MLEPESFALDLPEIARAVERHSQRGMLSWSMHRQIAFNTGTSLFQVERVCLECGILPARYQRNQNSFSTADQLRFHRSRVAVIGCGGLGGFIVELLARLGAGNMRLIDPDVFEEHNLNRQLLSTVNALGEHKAQAAFDRVELINPAVRADAICTALESDNALPLLEGCDLAIDALDSFSSRLVLAHACTELGIPLVHGAIGGWLATLAVQYPGDETLRQLYGDLSEDRGAEVRTGNPVFTPSFLASAQVAEAAKLITDRPALASGLVRTWDLESGRQVEIALPNGADA